MQAGGAFLSCIAFLGLLTDLGDGNLGAVLTLNLALGLGEPHVLDPEVRASEVQSVHIAKLIP